MRSDEMVKRRKRWNGTLLMRQVVLHPLVWRTLMQNRRRRPNPKEGNRHAKALRSSNSSISASSSKTLAVDPLDSGVWKYLPYELMERILDRLPLHSVIACRTVCKRWNEHIISTVLATAPLPKKTVVVYFPLEGDFLHQPLIVYNACKNGWDRHDMSFLHDGGAVGSYSLVAAQRGLLCFSDPKWTSFVMCNPLSKQWRVLQPPSSVLPHIPGMQVAGCPGNYILVGLVVDEEDGSYKLVLAGLIPKMVSCRRRVLNLSHSQQERQSRTTFVYDSRCRSWSAAPALPMPPPQLDFGVWSNECPRRSVTSEGKLYWSIVERNEDDIPVREIVRFDTHRGEWSNVALEEHNVRDLVILNGKIFAMKLWDGMRLMVRHTRGGGLRAFYANVGAEVSSSEWEGRMFEVQDEDVEDGGISLKKRRIPKVLQDAKKSQKATSDYSNQYSCIGQGTSLFVMHQVIDGDIEGEWEMQGWKVLHYDYSTDSCVRLPQLNTYLHEQFPLSWWTLEPSLAAIV
ncbi:unnamed protein product [Calypogeia fissa]